MEAGKTFLTVPEFAQAAGISQQAIYKQIRNGGKLSAYVVKKGKQTRLDAAALAEIYGLETFLTQNETFSTQKTTFETETGQPSELSKPEGTERSKPSEPDSTHESKPSEPETASKSELQAVLDILTEQLRVKDEQLKAQAEAQEEAQRAHKEELARKDAMIEGLLKSLQAEQHKVYLLLAPEDNKGSGDNIVDQDEEHAPDVPDNQEAEHAPEGKPDREEAADPDELQRLQAALKAQEQRTQEEQRKREEAEAQLTAERQKGFFQWLKDKFRG